MLVAVISDTHLPRGRRRLPEACVEWCERAEMILHAGDFSTRAAYEELRTLGRVEAVHGNVDDEYLRAELPVQTVVEVAGVRVGMVHDAGPAQGRLSRMRRRFPGADAVVFGHSHTPLHERDPASGFQIFNPGSPTDRRRQPRHTMGVARAGAGSVEFELVHLD